jgi:transcriptional regulator with XRE-family HTH domain
MKINQPAPAGVEIAGDRLRELRKLGGDNLRQLAEKVGVTLQYISQLERGDRTRTSPEVFVRICEAIGIPEHRREELTVKREVAA